MSNIVLTYRHYPVSIARYFRYAFETMGHNVWSAGTFSETVPWRPELDYTKFVDIPNYIIPSDMNVWDAQAVINQCPFTPEALISIDAGLHLIGANKVGIKNGIVLTDPHALPQFYLEAMPEYDKVFCMQADFYIEPFKQAHSAVWYLPYAASHLHHCWMGENFSERPFDLCFISGSLHHPKRAEALSELERVGLRMQIEAGLLYEDATREYNKSVIAFNRSTEQDVPARFFEGLAMRNFVLTERLQGLEYFDGLRDGIHYVAYSSLDEMVEKAMYYATNRYAAWKIATTGYAAFWEQDHTYLRRAMTILDVMGLG